MPILNGCVPDYIQSAHSFAAVWEDLKCLDGAWNVAVDDAMQLPVVFRRCTSVHDYTIFKSNVL